MAAYELDEALCNLSLQLGQDGGIPGVKSNLQTENDLVLLLDYIRHSVIANLHLEEYFLVDRELCLQMYANHTSTSISGTLYIDSPDTLANSGISGAKLANRFSRSKLAAALFDRVPSMDSLDKGLQILNARLLSEYHEHLHRILEAIASQIRWERLDANGPKLGSIHALAPLVGTYFTRFTDKQGTARALVNNGWMWSHDPLIDFAGPDSSAYLGTGNVI